MVCIVRIIRSLLDFPTNNTSTGTAFLHIMMVAAVDIAVLQALVLNLGIFANWYLALFGRCGSFFFFAFFPQEYVLLL